MADASKTLEIFIKTLADTTGITLTKEQTEQLTASLKKSADGTKDLGETSEVSHGHLKRLANLMGSDLPGSAALMESGFTAATEPMMSATFLLIGGIEMLRHAVQKINAEREQSKKLGEALADIDGRQTEAIQKQSEALENAEIAEAEYHHNYVRNAEDAIAKASNLAQAILKTQIAAGEANAGTRKGIAENAIEDMEQRGVISHATALKMKEQLDIAYEEQKLMRSIAQDKLERESMVNQLQTKQVGAEKLARDESAAQETYKTAAAAKAANDTKIQEAQEKIAAAKDFKKSLRDTGVTDDTVQQLMDSFGKVSGQDAGTVSLEEQFHYLSTHFGGIVPRELFGTQGDRNLALYEGANIDIAAGQSDLARAQKKRPDIDIAEGNAKSDLEATRRAQEKNRDDVRAVQDKITESDATNKLKGGGARQDLGMRQANDELIADRGIADRVQAGGAISDGEKQRLIAAASQIAGHHVDLKTAAQIIENGAKNIGIFMNQVSTLATVLGQFSPRQQADLQKQIDNLREQIKYARTRVSG